MRHVVFLTAILLSATSALGQDWEGDLLGLHGKLHGSVGVAWDSQYIWRGFDVYDDKSAVHLLADVDLFQTGFGISVAGHRANSSGFEEQERWDYTAYYQNSLFQDQPYETQYRFGWVYYNFPELWSQRFDLQEAHGILSWPKLLPIKGLCPSYAAIRLWPSRSNSTVERRHISTDVSGWWHILMLDYGFTVPGLGPKPGEQMIKLHSELVYNDGVSPMGTNVPSGFSNAVFGVSTDFDLGHGITLTPAVYYQRSMVKAVNPDDEFWVSVGLRYSF